MKTSELIEAIALKSGLPKSTVALVLDTLPEVALEALKGGENVVLLNFGAFEVMHMRKKPLFGKPQSAGTWKKIRFRLSRRVQANWRK